LRNAFVNKREMLVRERKKSPGRQIAGGRKKEGKGRKKLAEKRGGKDEFLD